MPPEQRGGNYINKIRHKKNKPRLTTSRPMSEFSNKSLSRVVKGRKGERGGWGFIALNALPVHVVKVQQVTIKPLQKQMIVVNCSLSS